MTRLAPPLPAPISGESLAVVNGELLILGGLDSAGESVSGTFLLNRSSGRVSPVGSLTGPLHDAAAASLGSGGLVLGGGTTASTDLVQGVRATFRPAGSEATAEPRGRLPTALSDLSAVSIGGRVFVLGGYDGSRLSDSVLATKDGSKFREIGHLPVPGRYLATAALNGRIYAFGGESSTGRASDAIQEIDPGAGSAQVVGRLPHPLSHAAAVTLGGSIYLLGGEAGQRATDAIWRYDPSTGTLKADGRLPSPIAAGAAAVVGGTGYLIGGVGADGTALATVVTLRVTKARRSSEPTAVAHRAAQRAPFAGRLMIADRGNDRLLVVDSSKHLLWRFPSARHPAPPGGFYFPDDAFFTHHGTRIISNEEQNERIVQLGFPSGRLRWSYGHPGVTGTESGYLHEPDDAYLLKDGLISVADAQNCRVLLISQKSRRVRREIGSPSACVHEPPRYLGSPNGDTPLRNGDMLISEVNGSYIDEITPGGRLVWSAQLPISYPSDPQQLAANRYLVADYARPGGIYEFNRKGRILWAYHPASGPRMLDHPSLAERLPGGLIAVNDDYRDRVVIIDPRTRSIVWQYGHTDEPGTRRGYLNTPDGLDLLAPDGTTPTHPFTR